jgi:methylase of polypeptide subunit release factors
MTKHPIPDRDAATTLGTALRKVGYSEDAVYELLGEDAYSADRDDAPVHDRRLSQTRLATVVRVFFLQLPVSRRDAVQALGEGGVEALEATGLAEVAEELAPRARILPIGELLLASDGFSRDAEDPPDYVATYTPTARVLDSLTPRPRVERALDVGTGSGVHALFAARHARHVVATDVNARALAYTELNAALNGLSNVETRLGSLFEPVAGETFDLVTFNAPYVVSPERRWAYRDSGFEADEISERVVREAAEHLADGGFAALLVSWLASDEDAPDERVLGWADATGCDSWILPTLGSDPLAHAAEWNSHLADDPEAFGAALDKWTRYFDDLGVRWVSEGAVLLHRQSGRPPATRVDAVDEDDLDDAADQILRAFEARARLSELAEPAELLGARLSAAVPMSLEQELDPTEEGVAVSGAHVQLVDGTNTSLEVDPRVLDVIASLDGGVPLRDVVQATADRLGLSGAQIVKLQNDALSVSRELLELGALRFR